MLVIPAIDLKAGKVVRLLQGKYEEITVYSSEPGEIAAKWQAQGAGRIHIIDLDGAKSGRPENIEALSRIVKSINIPVQCGGGLRTREDIAAVINAGAKWVILGTRACEDLAFAKEIVAEFNDRIIVSIDVRNKKVALRGWTETSQIEDVEMIKKLQAAGVKSFIYTDISRDGTLSGANIEGVRRVLEKTGASIFCSGGVSSMKDISNLATLEEQGLKGLIIGKALYEEKIDLGEVKIFLEKSK